MAINPVRPRPHHRAPRLIVSSIRSNRPVLATGPNGHVLAGSYQGASLDALDRATLMKLLSEIDDDSRDLLAAYLDRRQPGWREYAQRDAGADARPAGAGKMTEEEAYQILGLQPGASMEEIRRAQPIPHKEITSRPRGDDVSRGSHR